MVRMRPPPLRFISGTAACTIRTRLSTFCSNAFCHCASDIDAKSPAGGPACVVDDDVEAAVLRDGGVDELPGLVLAADVGGNRGHAALWSRARCSQQPRECGSSSRLQITRSQPSRASASAEA